MLFFLSQWPPYWSPYQAGDPPEDDFLKLMKEYQTVGKSILKRVPDLFVKFDEYEIEMAAKNEYPLNSKHPLVNSEWDQKFMDRFCAGDSKWLSELTYEEVEEEAGHGKQLISILVTRTTGSVCGLGHMRGC